EAAAQGVTSRGRGDNLLFQQIMQSVGAGDQGTCRDGLWLKVLNDKGAVVVGEQTDMVRSIQPDEQLLAHESADLVQHAPGQPVEVGKVIRNGQQTERALAVSGRGGHGISRQRRLEVDQKPVVILEAPDLREEYVQPEFHAKN